MTPKEKAQELFDKMLFCYQGNIDEYTAKQCALICCNEVLGYMGADRGYQYWTEVKQEIEKL